MTKSERSIINIFRQKYDINVTFDPFSLGDRLINELSANIGERIIYQKRVDNALISQLKDIVSKNPDFPIFYNYLYSAYLIIDDDQKAHEIIDKVIHKFPEYIFGVTQKSILLVKDGLLDEATKYIGTEMDIKKRFPKDLYHFSEIKSYYIVQFELAYSQENPARAKEALKILWELYRDQNDLMTLAKKYQSLVFSQMKIFKHVYTITDYLERTKLNIAEQAYDQDIYDLIYDQEYFDDPDLLLKKYKPEYICGELHKICISIYHNFENIDDYEHTTLPEAFRLLSTANYNDAFPLFMTYLSQDKDFEEYFWEDDDDKIVFIAFNFGKNNPDPLLDFLSEEPVTDFVKEQVFEALVQLVLHGFLHEDRLKMVYGQLLDKYLTRLEKEEPVPTYLLTMAIPMALNLNDKSLLLKAKPFFEANKIDVSFYGNYEDHEKKMAKWELRYAKKHYPRDWTEYLSKSYLELNQRRPLTEEEKEIWRGMHQDSFDMFLVESLTQMLSGERVTNRDEIAVNRHEESKPVVKSNKIGRNDPCPCGSGKKFKKCCVNKGIFK